MSDRFMEIAKAEADWSAYTYDISGGQGEEWQAKYDGFMEGVNWAINWVIDNTSLTETELDFHAERLENE